MFLNRFKKLSVTPPFMHGARLPMISGLIRFNEEVSEETKRVVLPKFRNLGATDLTLVEVVSDDTVQKSHEREHIEAGSAFWAQSTLDNVRSTIVFGAHSIGPTNQSKSFHAHQGRVAAQWYAEEWLAEQGGGLSVILHDQPITDDPGLQIVNKLIVANTVVGTTNGSLEWKLEMETNRDIFSPFLKFSQSFPLESYLLTNGSTLLGGIADAGQWLTDPFVTMDCPEGLEKSVLAFMQKKLRQKPIIYSQNDKYMHSLLGGEESLLVSAVPIGLSIDVQKQLTTKPWLCSTLLPFLASR